jgi:hypothetical protein
MAVERMGTGEEMPVMAADERVKLRALALDEVRWWRYGGLVSVHELPPGSVPEALAEVEEALETVEALCAARSIWSSRVRRFT